MLYDADDLRNLPTISQGQCCNLKKDFGDIRVWLCRVGGGVTIEKRDSKTGRWETVEGGCMG